ncbi:MAG: alpha/beta hydrolase [Candidatus Caldarchaeum sp.]|jgi:pimeloyl-ACP methyl ester carboxylesterase
MRNFINTPKGQIHFRWAGEGKPVVLLHQTPRSSDEYTEVLPLLGQKFHAIAMDTIGFGDSYRFEGEMTIERLAEGVIEFTEALRLNRISLVGHHTGAVIAIEIAATHPDLVEKLVLSGCPYIDAEEREKRKNKQVIDTYVSKMDGSHLLELWKGRQPYYPPDRPDILDRFIIDALKAGPNAAAGHLAVSRYVMEEKITKIICPTLIIVGKADPFATSYLPKLRNSIKHARVVEIEGGTVALLEQKPREFAEAVTKFLENSE